jgi:hypothetical protein
MTIGSGGFGIAGELCFVLGGSEFVTSSPKNVKAYVTSERAFLK